MTNLTLNSITISSELITIYVYKLTSQKGRMNPHDPELTTMAATGVATSEDENSEFMQIVAFIII